MVDRQVHGWIRARDERTGPWARLPSPADDLLDRGPLGRGADPVGTGHHGGSTPFPQPSAGRPVFLRSAGRAPSSSGSASEVRPGPHPRPWHHPTPGPWHQPTPGPRFQPTGPGHLPSPDHQPTPQHQPTPAVRAAAPPRVIPLGGDLALVSVGQWDEESATTIQMPAVVDEPEAPFDQTEDGRPVSDRD